MVFLYLCMQVLLVVAGVGERIGGLITWDCALVFDGLLMLSDLCIWGFDLWTLNYGLYHVLWGRQCPKPDDVMLDVLCVICVHDCYFIIIIIIVGINFGVKGNNLLQGV